MPQMPSAALRDTSTQIDNQATVDESGLLAKEDALRKERELHMGALKDKRGAALAGYDSASKDLESSIGKRETVSMPDPNLGPPIDPDVFKNFMGGVMALALIGAVGGRKHYTGAAEAMNGALMGFREGNMEIAREKKSEFDRKFKEAQAAQAKADKQYTDILSNKKLTLNMAAEKVKLSAIEFEDWDMLAKAQQHDFDGMHRRIDSNRKRADQMKNLAARLDEQKMFKDMAASAKAEKDKAGATAFDDQDVSYWADVLKKGGDLPPRLATTPGGKELVQKVMKSIAHGGTTPDEMLANKAEFQGLKAGERTAATRSANVDMAVNEAINMKPILVKASEEFKRTGYQPVNKALKAFEDKTGSVESRRFGAAVNTYINVYARAVSPTGTPTVSDKDHAREVLSMADSHEQLVGLVGILDSEMKAAKASPGQTKADMREGFTGKTRRAGDKSFASEAEAEAAATRGELKAGDRVTVGGQQGTWQ